MKLLQSSCPGHRLDAAHPRRNASLGGDLQQPDVPGAADVGPPAKLFAELRHRHDANALRILLAEKRQRPGLERLIEFQNLGLDRRVPHDGGVRQPLDLFQFVSAHRGEMGEVKAQPRRLDHRPRLLYMPPQDLAERRVQQVRPGMVAHGGAALLGIHNGSQAFSDPNRRAARDPMRDHPGDRAVGILNNCNDFLRLLVQKHPGIPDLPASLGIKRRVV